MSLGHLFDPIFINHYMIFRASIFIFSEFGLSAGQIASKAGLGKFTMASAIKENFTEKRMSS